MLFGRFSDGFEKSWILAATFLAVLTKPHALNVSIEGRRNLAIPKYDRWLVIVVAHLRIAA